MKQFPFIYSVKVWATALAVCGIIMAVLWGDARMLGLTMLFGFVYSIPAYLLFLALAFFVFNQDWPVLKKKVILGLGLNFFVGILVLFLINTSFDKAANILYITIFPAAIIAVLVNKSE